MLPKPAAKLQHAARWQFAGGGSAQRFMRQANILCYVLNRGSRAMYSVTEMQGQSGLLHKSGTVEINSEYVTRKKPVWLVLLKLAGVAAMVAVGAAIGVPTLLEFEFPLWQAIAITVGGMMVYMGVAFFLRPEANTDNLGWGGGLANDPFQSSDNVNRFLWKLHCALGPGRFTAETLLDLCVLIGVARGAEIVDTAPPAEHFTPGTVALITPSVVPTKRGSSGDFDASQPIAPLDPNRFALSSANSVTEIIQRDSRRFSNPPPAAG
jgi:hypothetical protein